MFCHEAAVIGHALGVIRRVIMTLDNCPFSCSLRDAGRKVLPARISCLRPRNRSLMYLEQ